MTCFLGRWLILILLLTGCSQKKSSDVPKGDSQLVTPFAVGFRILKDTDRSRIYKPATQLQDSLHFRPLDIDLWYPAQAGATSEVLHFKDLLGLLETRANFYSAPATFTGITGEVAKSFCEAFKCSTPDTLLGYKTNSHPESKPADPKFPLIVYLCSYNGMSYENFTLFEALARKGYVVAAVTSIGRYPGEMTMKTADLMEQVKDAEFILPRLKSMNTVDSTRIGVIGYSWGGLAGALLTMQRTDIKAVVSLDGSEFHHYGQSKAEDQDFDATVNSSFFKSAYLTAPYLRLESNPQPDSSKNDSIYPFLGKIKGEKRHFKVVSATHQDFSCLPYVVKSSGGCPSNPLHLTITDLTVQYFDKYLKQQSNEFNQTIKVELGKTITEVSKVN